MKRNVFMMFAVGMTLAGMLSASVKALAGENEEANAEIFNQPLPSDSNFQVITGVFEYLGGHYLVQQGLSKEESVAATETKDRIEELESEIEEVQQDTTLSRAARQSKLAHLGHELAKERVTELKIVTSAKVVLGKPLLKMVQIVGGSVLILDAFGRYYVWDQLNRNPTFSPGATLLLHAAKTLSK